MTYVCIKTFADESISNGNHCCTVVILGHKSCILIVAEFGGVYTHTCACMRMLFLSVFYPTAIPQ